MTVNQAGAKGSRGFATPTLGVVEDKDPILTYEHQHERVGLRMSPTGRKVMSAKTQARLAKGPGTTIGVRCHEPLLAMLDAYRRNEPDLPTRASALRRLAIIALKASKER